MLNKVTLIGRLGADPELRYMPKGGAVANIRLATTRRYKNKQSGERVEDTEWHRVIFFTRLAEIVGEYLRKGSLIYVEGRIRTQKWQDKEGNDRYTTEIVAGSMQMLDSRGGHDGQSSSPVPSSEQSAPAANNPPKNLDDFDDVPF